ncbi:DUF4268 domain-containing protein [Paraburkholderia sabiae]|uniref:DUF4268 domain-containing protein n=1 Tax=Paraburkholderia sabiae TaxID=273251 RepID=A0ABU9QL53_9BURK|nr:DUF4268 domain-containing protein [Paraburkholderia sabiae]WJZ77350.1 DUF4268 domain-containing protein [Paraburkholderia sabiae]CAD6547706.1 hypothetical protein LMG24235_04468 [Paraburkholderia sabiae]
MSRNSFSPLLISAQSQTIPLRPVVAGGREGDYSEADLQRLIHAHPSCLPIAEIDAVFSEPIAICTELETHAGRIDNFMVTASGLPVLVECKLWRNPEARREVVGQILDYAKELTRWSSSDLQREVRDRLNRGGDPILEMVRAVSPDTDEIQFNDALTANLRRGRFLLLIVGDGIREGVEAISEYLQAHAGLHFTLGLVEMRLFATPDGGRLVIPRVLVRTRVLTHTVVAVPDGHMLVAGDADDADAGPASLDPARAEVMSEQQQFWSGFLQRLRLDDPEQGIPKPARQGYLNFMLHNNAWLNVYRNQRRNEIGVELSSNRNTAGEYAMRAIVDDWPDISREIGGTAAVFTRADGRPTVHDCRIFPNADAPGARDQMYDWLAERTNAFVNALRPRVRSAAADFQRNEA